ncbi:rhoptry protein ROP4 [Toxoplasma gondii TgCatPRC2]|uniref:Rhoptry protein ROP4 n=1 Tax=Toxoplasma gondii TgCatPRC2 TaxID=1130821 RepID=A0A151GYX8_TOXGO|nr:rhoptry protein ROP4 [Toxoplasma gondii TgCatPRC2]
MGHPTSFGQPSCLVWLAAAVLVLGLCLVQQGAGRQRPHQWKSSEAALSVSPAGDIVDKYSRDSTEGENTVSEGEAEGSRGGSWLEQEGVELRSPSQDSQTGTSTASPTGFRRYLRFLAPFDLVTIPGKPLVQKAKSRNEVGWVKNLLFLLPPTHVDMETFVDEIGRFPQEDRPLADAARLYLTVQAVRLVAHLQDEGVVHGKIMPDSFCLKREGGLYLRDFGSLVRAGAKVVVPAEYDEYTPPEGRAAARSRFGSGATTMTYAFDAWTLGSVIFLIWCSRAPDTKSGYEYSVEFFFSRCRRVPENVKLLVYKLINPSVEARLLALQAIETPEYREMEEQLSAASRLYSGDGTLTGGDDDMPPLET